MRMNSALPRVLHITHQIGRSSTGLGSVTINLTKALCDLGVDAQIWCVDDESSIQWASSWSGLSADRIRGFRGVGLGLPGFSFDIERAAASPDNSDFAVVHEHGIWSGVSRVVNIMRNVHRTPTVVAPQGSLHQNALNKSRWKKRIALPLYEKRNLFGASCLHALSENELGDFRDFGLLNPIAIIPNGISPNWVHSNGKGEVFRHQFSIPEDKRILLFLSRINRNKGLLMLVDVLEKMGKTFEEWQLIIAGADESGHRAEVERAIREKELTDAVKFVGPIFDQIKRDAFAAADLFILPSLNEAAPLVVLEALGAGIPVLATKASPWEDLEKHGCGWWVGISTREMTEALMDAVRTSRGRLAEMGQRGKDLVVRKYLWSASAQMCIEMYEWLRGNNKTPDFVITD